MSTYIFPPNCYNLNPPNTLVPDRHAGPLRNQHSFNNIRHNGPFGHGHDGLLGKLDFDTDPKNRRHPAAKRPDIMRHPDIDRMPALSVGQPDDGGCATKAVEVAAEKLLLAVNPEFASTRYVHRHRQPSSCQRWRRLRVGGVAAANMECTPNPGLILDPRPAVNTAQRAPVHVRERDVNQRPGAIGDGGSSGIPSRDTILREGAGKTRRWRVER